MYIIFILLWYVYIVKYYIEYCEKAIRWKSDNIKNKKIDYMEDATPLWPGFPFRSLDPTGGSLDAARLRRARTLCSGYLKDMM